MNKKSYKDNLTADIAQMRTVAEEIIKSGKLNLNPGTYTAAQIDRELRKVENDYFDDTYRKAERLRSEDQQGVDIRYRFFKVSNDLGWRMFPGGVVFRLLKSYERDAGLSGRKSYHFNVPESRIPIVVSKISFPSQKTMLELSKAIRRRNTYRRKFCVLSLSDGCLRGRFSNYRYIAGKKEAVLCEPYRVIPSEYNGIDLPENLSFIIGANLVKNIYGQCTIAVYKDEFPDVGKTNPYHFRVVITNSDGWVTSSDITADFPANKFDRLFYFEPIVRNNDTLVLPHKSIDDESVPHEPKCPKCFDYGDKPSVRAERKSFCARDQRLKHLQRHKHIHRPHLYAKAIKYRKREELVKCKFIESPDSSRTGDY